VFDNETKQPGFWKRFLIGAALVVFASASATAVAAFREVDRVVDAFRENTPLELGSDLAKTDPGKPQTIMVIGSDRRANSSDPLADDSARSDTVILVRLDPGKEATALMSLPRDLKVRIPGHGTDKLNAAFSIGGPKLTLKTVKELTGLRINHVINTDFRGFRDAVNAIGCVYVDIDRRYYNADTSFAAIDIGAGYQRLCGDRALEYARFRHEDNDLVRGARQQDFLREAKGQIGNGKLISDRKKLVKIFGKYTTTDIDSRAEVLRLLKLAVFSADQPIREVHFEGEIGESFVTASSRGVRKLAQQFLGVEETKGPRGKLKPKGEKQQVDAEFRGLEKVPAEGRDQALQARSQTARFPIWYPTVRTARALFAGPPRVYQIKGPGGKKYPAYRMVIKRGLVGDYYGVQGTTWQDPPILQDPQEKRKIGKRTFELHFDGDRLRLVAWRTRRGVYWIANTLLQTLTKRQMLTIARSTRSL
jgi:polyisoprenyl-teichoic acid--peptidoglycan teichoic acid transferase